MSVRVSETLKKLRDLENPDELHVFRACIASVVQETSGTLFGLSFEDGYLLGVYCTHLPVTIQYLRDRKAGKELKHIKYIQEESVRYAIKNEKKFSEIITLAWVKFYRITSEVNNTISGIKWD